MAFAASLLPTIITTQEFFQKFHSRRLLLHSPLFNSPPLANPPSSQNSSQNMDNNTFDANVVLILSILLCALICSIGLNSIIRCALRCSTVVSSNSSNHTTPSARLANTGVKKKALKTFPTISYTPDLKLPGLGAECAICLSDFVSGEHLKVLPKCHHAFHIRCIDKWLNSHSSCPTCRHCLIETCQKIVGCSQTASAPGLVLLQTPQDIVVIRIEPLQPEGLIRNH